MRSTYTVALLVILATAAPFFAYAAGEVLVPTDNGASSTPNLGLVPSAPAAAPASPPASPQYATPATSLPYTPPVASPTTSASPNAPPHATMAAGTAISAQPTKVIKLPDAPASTTASAQLPNSLTITLTGKLQPNQIKTINGHLGIAEDKIPTHCNLSASGMIQSDKMPGQFDLGTASHGVGKYDGKISIVLVMVKALCDTSTPLPAGKGIVLQSGDKYMVMLGGGQCQPTAGTTPKTATISVGDDPRGLPTCVMK